MFFSRKKKCIAQLKEDFGTLRKDFFNFDQIKKYHINKDTSESFQLITDQIWEDLDMELFYAHIDHTSSAVGQQCLYDQLRNINYNPEKHTKQENVIAELENCPDDIAEIQYILEKLNNRKSYYLTSLFQGKHLKLPKWFFVVPLLSIMAISTIVLSFFYPSYLLLLLLVFLVNVAIHYYNKLNVNLYIDSIPMLLTLNSVAKKLMKFKQLSPLSANTKRSIGIIDQIKRRIAVFKLEQKVESDVEMAYWFILELIKIMFLLEPLLLFSVIGKLKTKRKEIEDVFSYVGKVDVILSTIALRKASERYCMPTLDQDQHSIEAVEILHPLVANCIPNSFKAASKSFLLTGSNMSGKTTFIRAIGLNIISGLCLNTCFAQSFSFPVIKMHTAIRISDDISSASSYFFKEVETVNAILHEAIVNQGNIVLLDELFKGTNTIERIASAKAILSYLHQHNCFVFVSTHDIELTNMLKTEYDLFHFEESINSGKISFDYKLKKGIPAKGNAIKILKLNDFPSIIIEEATRIASKQQKKRTLTKVTDAHP
ncbi:MAG: DNA mismatch repair protein MutS [Crocinitomicaceae bacterium]|nr:DNA mismatch repair protein MutS [Crocinitomicaceae bacterium]